MTTQQEIARNAQSGLAKAKHETEKVEQEVEQAKAALLIIQSDANQATYVARQEAEQANEQLMRETNRAEKIKNEAEKAKLEATKAIKEAEKAKTESNKANKEAEKAAHEILIASQAKQESKSKTKDNITKCITNKSKPDSKLNNKVEFKCITCGDSFISIDLFREHVEVVKSCRTNYTK